MMTLEEAIMANDSQKAKKIKTPFAKMVVEGNQEKHPFRFYTLTLLPRIFMLGTAHTVWIMFPTG